MSTYGVFLKQETDNPDELMIQYPLSQATGNVELVFSEQQQKSTLQPKKEVVEKEQPKPKAVKDQEQQSQQPQEEQPKPVVTYEEQQTGFRTWLRNIIQRIINWF